MPLSITPLQLQQIPDVKFVIATVCLEIFQPPLTVAQFLEQLESRVL